MRELIFYVLSFHHSLLDPTELHTVLSLISYHHFDLPTGPADSHIFIHMHDNMRNRLGQSYRPRINNLSEFRVEVLSESFKKPHMALNLLLIRMLDHKADRHRQRPKLSSMIFPNIITKIQEIIQCLPIDSHPFSLFLIQPHQELVKREIINKAMRYIVRPIHM